MFTMLRFGIAFFDGSAQSQSELDQKLLLLAVTASRYLLGTTSTTSYLGITPAPIKLGPYGLESQF